MTGTRPPPKDEIKNNVCPVPKPLAEAVLAMFKAIWPNAIEGKRNGSAPPMA